MLRDTFGFSERAGRFRESKDALWVGGNGFRCTLPRALTSSGPKGAKELLEMVEGVEAAEDGVTGSYGGGGRSSRPASGGMDGGIDEM